MGRPRKNKYTGDEETNTEQLQDKLHQTHVELVIAEDGNVSMVDDQEKIINWKKQVHDSLQYVLEKGDELEERISSHDQKLNLLGEDYTAVKQRINNIEDNSLKVNNLEKKLEEFQSTHENV